jgi:putative transposase
VKKVCEKLVVSERRACQVLGQFRASQRYIPLVTSEEERLRAAIVRLACRFGRYGYRRITALLREDGWQVNHKSGKDLASGRTKGAQEAAQAGPIMA